MLIVRSGIVVFGVGAVSHIGVIMGRLCWVYELAWFYVLRLLTYPSDYQRFSRIALPFINGQVRSSLGLANGAQLLSAFRRWVFFRSVSYSLVFGLLFVLSLCYCFFSGEVHFLFVSPTQHQVIERAGNRVRGADGIPPCN